MVAGMTPSTVKAGFVSAVLDAGYHIELAGGGHYNAAALRSKVAEIQKLTPAGVGITLNALYINPRQFTFQFPLWQEMRKEGLPIEGFCVAAGIPTTEKAVEIIEGLKAAGLKHVFVKSSTLPRPTRTSLSSCSGLEVAPALITPLRTSINPFSPPIALFVNTRTSPLSVVQALDQPKMYGSI
jgi:hypothetical protein